MQQIPIASEEFYKLQEPFRLLNVMERGSHFYLKPHKHDFYQIIVVTEGQLEVLTNTSNYVLESGEAIVLAPEEMHALKSDNGYKQIGLDIISKRDERAIYDLFTRCITSGSVKVYLPNISEQYDIFMHRMQHMTILNALQLTNSAEQILFTLIEAIEDTKEKSFRFTFNEIVKENQGYLLSLDELASLMNMSKSTLERTMKQEFGYSVIDYCNQVRLRYACQYLRLTDAPLQEISERLGYHDNSHFSRSFKKHLGITPSHYRQEYKQKV